MPYQPTGNPSGRPRKDGLPPGTKPEPPPREDGPLCGQCFPKGWASLDGAEFAGCAHGSWVK